MKHRQQRKAARLVDPDRTYPAGHKLVGEPMPARPGPNLGPARKGAAYPMPEIARARAKAMGRKMLDGTGVEINEIPDDGGGLRSGDGATGARLDVVAASRAIPQSTDGFARLVQQGEVISPPYDLWQLVCTVEESDTLPHLIDAMATNIGGFGWDLEPQFELVDEDGAQIDPPPEAEEEKADLELFLSSCNVPLGLEGLMDRVDRDIETTGNGYLEGLRDGGGMLAALEHLPAYTMRLGRLSPPILVEVPFRHPTTGEIVILPRWRRFRTYCQEREGRITWFKELGDPRALNSSTGEYKAAGSSWGVDRAGSSLDATEVIHLTIYATHSPYGVPRWIGATPHVRGARSAADLIVRWFNDAPIGAKVAAIAGGVWKQTSVDALVDKIDDMARGEENSFGILFLEGDPSAERDPIEETKDAPPRIEFTDLTFSLPDWLTAGGESGLLDSAARRTARTFRLPPIYWGGSDDYSRAAANTARSVTEEQVFVPIRRLRWGSVFNNLILPTRGVNQYKLGFRGANTSDDASDGVEAFTAGGGTSPNELIRLWNERSGGKREPIPEPWADRPLALTLALLEKGLDPNKSLDEIAVDVQAQQEEAAAQAADEAKARTAALAGGGKPGGFPGGGGPKGGPPKPVKVGKREGQAVAQVYDLVALRQSLMAEIARRKGSG